jgi:TRAP transporter TAXI family solute receptor
MVRRAVCSALLACLPFVGGCQKGPEGDLLQTQVQQKLDQAFQEGLFKVTYLARNGSYSFNAEDGSPRLLLYYKARIEFQADYDFAAWGQLNLAALASVLGATPEGVTGVVHEGNKQGDVLGVFGTITYAQDGDQWVVSTGPSPEGEAADRAAGMDQASAFEETLDGLGERFRDLENKRHTAHVAALEEEVELAVRAIGLRLDMLDGRPTLVTGAESGEYYAVGRGLAAVAAETDVELGHYASSGSVENCRLVGAGKADFALVQNDIAHMAHTGQGLFAGQPLTNLRAVCSLYPELVQVVTLASSGITRIDGLAGKRVNLGPQGSGSRLNAVHVLAAHGLPVDALASADDLDLPDAVRALKAGEIDALFVTSAAPVRPLEELAGAVDVVFLGLGKEALAKLRADQPFLTPIAIPRNTYRGVSQPVPTLGVTAMLVTRSDASAEHVGRLFELLFEQPTLLVKASPRAALINRGTARVGLSIPLHPAAASQLPEE